MRRGPVAAFVLFISFHDFHGSLLGSASGVDRGCCSRALEFMAIHMSFFCRFVAVQVFIVSCRVGTAKPKDLEARRLPSFLQVGVSTQNLLTARFAMRGLDLLNDVRHWGSVCCARKPAGGDGLPDSFFYMIWLPAFVWEEPDPASASSCAILASEWSPKLEDKAVHSRMKQQENGPQIVTRLTLNDSETPGDFWCIWFSCFQAFILYNFMMPAQVFLESFIAKSKDLEAQMCKTFSQQDLRRDASFCKWTSCRV